MFLKLLSIEATKLYSRLMTWVELILFSGMAGGAYLLLNVLRPGRSGLLLPDAINHSYLFSMVLGSSLGGLFFVVLVGAFVAQEYSWGTFSLLLSRGVRRSDLLLAKLLVLLPFAILIVILPFVVSGLVSAIFTYKAQGSLAALGQVNWVLFLEMIGMAALSLLPYGALAFLLAVLTHSPVVAIGITGGFSLIVENILIRMLALFGNPYAVIIPYLPTGMVYGLISGTGIIPSDGMSLLAPFPAALGLGIYTLLFLGIAMWFFQRQDLGSGS